LFWTPLLLTYTASSQSFDLLLPFLLNKEAARKRQIIRRGRERKRKGYK